MRRIAIASLKGGVGKSTTATALAVSLAARGHKTLLVDCDGQANASWTLLGGQGAEPPTLGAVLLREADADEAIRPSTTPGLDVLPSDTALSGANVSLIQELGRDARLRAAMAPLEGRWEFVVLDTPPTATTVLVNALVYAREVIVPVEPGMYAVLGLVEMQGTVESVRDAYNPDLRLTGLLLTRVPRSNVARDVEQGLRERYGELVCAAVIPVSAKIEEAGTNATTVMTFAPKSAGALAYAQFVSEVLDDGCKQTRGGERDAGIAGADGAAA